MMRDCEMLAHEQLPVNNNGKIVKKELRQPCAAGTR